MSHFVTSDENCFTHQLITKQFGDRKGKNDLSERRSSVLKSDARNFLVASKDLYDQQIANG
jgi:hypothetical protein